MTAQIILECRKKMIYQFKMNLDILATIISNDLVFK